jgi:hypothetical protein
VAVQQVAVDAFGNALGQGLVDASSSGSTLTTGDFARADGVSYRGLPYDPPNAANGLQLAVGYGLRLAPGAVAAMDDGINEARGTRVLTSMRDADIDAQPARLSALLQERAAQSSGPALGSVLSEWDDNITPLPSLTSTTANAAAVPKDRVGNWIRSLNVPDLPGGGWLSQSQAVSSAQYWQERLDSTGNPIYALAQGASNLWADHAQEVGTVAMSIRGGGLKLSAPDGELQLVTRNQIAGAGRQALVDSELALQYPNATVQSERYLRLENGERAIDPLSGTARRIDSVVIENGAALDSVETTSMTASKDAQILKEMRIRQSGGTFVRDMTTGQLVDVSQVPTRIVRKP